MGKPKNIGSEIIRMKTEGIAYNEIAIRLKCSRSTLSYHLGKQQKEKNRERQRRYRKKSHPYKVKLGHFIEKKSSERKLKNKLLSYKTIIGFKIRMFCLSYDDRRNMCKKKGCRMGSSVNFTVEDVINKFTENPKCYLTGEKIDIYKPRTYHFDHIIPVSRGGTCTIDNLGICTKQANMAKSDMTLQEFYRLCQAVVHTIEQNPNLINNDLKL